MAYIVQQSAQGSCDHQGTATATSVAPNVMVNGEPVVIIPAPFTVAGCSLNASGSPVPCVTLMFSQGATKVKANGVPVLLDSGTPQAMGPLGVQGAGSLKSVQTKVKAR